MERVPIAFEEALARRCESTSRLKGQIKPNKGITPEDVVTLSIYLGHFDFVASAIRHDAMDENLYKAWNKTVVIKTWNVAERYINARREKTGQTSLYEHSEHLAQEWQGSGS